MALNALESLRKCRCSRNKGSKEAGGKVRLERSTVRIKPFSLYPKSKWNPLMSSYREGHVRSAFENSQR